MPIDYSKVQFTWFDPKKTKETTRLLQLSFPQEDWSIESLREYFYSHNKINVIKVLKYDSEVIGVVLYIISKEVRCRIERLAVHPAYRRQGVGSYMLRWLISPERPSRLRYFNVYVPERNVVAQLFFKNLGFQFDPKELRKKDENGEDLYRFRYKRRVSSRIKV